MTSLKRIKVVLITPSAIISEGLRRMFEEKKRIEFYSFSDIELFTEKRSKIHPDMVLLDPIVIDYSKKNTIKTSLIKDIPLLAIVYTLYDSQVLSQFDDVIHIYDAAPTILKKIEETANSENNPKHKNEQPELSEREKDILVSIAQGLTNKEIADKHHISIHTAISHRKNITRKTGIKSVSGLTVYALLNNLIKESDFD